MASLADKGKDLFKDATALQNKEHEQLKALGASDYESKRLVELNEPSLIQEMMKACEKGGTKYANKIKMLLIVGANPDTEKDGCSGLHTAAWNGNDKCIQCLADGGAKIDLPDKAGFKGTPLHWAAENGHVETCKLLIKLGASKDAKTEHGLTPKAIALKWGQKDAAAVL